MVWQLMSTSLSLRFWKESASQRFAKRGDYDIDGFDKDHISNHEHYDEYNDDNILQEDDLNKDKAEEDGTKDTNKRHESWAIRTN